MGFHTCTAVACSLCVSWAFLYTPLTAVSATFNSTAQVTSTPALMLSTSQPESTSSYTADAAVHMLASTSSSSANEQGDAVLDDILELLSTKHSTFGSSTSGLEMMRKRLRRVQWLQSCGQWEAFLHTIGSAVPLAHRHRAAIRVQPTAVGRRRPGVTRGSKRLPTGRPAKSDKRPPAKRRRSFHHNVQANQPNAKPHGSAH